MSHLDPITHQCQACTYCEIHSRVMLRALDMSRRAALRRRGAGDIASATKHRRRGEIAVLLDSYCIDGGPICEHRHAVATVMPGRAFVGRLRPLRGRLTCPKRAYFCRPNAACRRPVLNQECGAPVFAVRAEHTVTVRGEIIVRHQHAVTSIGARPVRYRTRAEPLRRRASGANKYGRRIRIRATWKSLLRVRMPVEVMRHVDAGARTWRVLNHFAGALLAKLKHMRAMPGSSSASCKA